MSSSEGTDIVLDVYIVPKESKDILFGNSPESINVVSEIETMSSPKDLEVPIMKQKTFLVGGANGVLEWTETCFCVLCV